MGQSTDAILAYGYVWDEEHDLFDQDEDSEDEWFETVAKKRGIANPWDMYRSSSQEAAHRALPYGERDDAYKSWKTEVGFDALLNIWDEEKDKIKTEYGGVMVGSHCSCDYPMPFIAIEDSHLQAWRGSPVEVSRSHIEGPQLEIWDNLLDAYVEYLGIDISEAKGPGWFLVSNRC